MSENWNTRESIIQRIQLGTDDEAWEEFEACYRPFIYFLLKQVNVDFSDRDDVVQEILLNLHKNIRKYIKQNSRFRTWLGTVIRNTAKNHLIKQSRYDKNINKYHQSLGVFETHTNAEIDALIMVVKAGQTDTSAVDRALDTISNVRSPLIGAILNGANPKTLTGKYSYYYSYYNYYYQDDDDKEKQ